MLLNRSSDDVDPAGMPELSGSDLAINGLQPPALIKRISDDARQHDSCCLPPQQLFPGLPLSLATLSITYHSVS